MFELSKNKMKLKRMGRKQNVVFPPITTPFSVPSNKYLSNGTKTAFHSIKFNLFYIKYPKIGNFTTTATMTSEPLKHWIPHLKPNCRYYYSTKAKSQQLVFQIIRLYQNKTQSAFFKLLLNKMIYNIIFGSSPQPKLWSNIGNFPQR